MDSSPSPVTRNSWASTEFICLERSVLSSAGLLDWEAPRQLGARRPSGGTCGGWRGWHVQCLVSGLCPQVTWGGTRQPGLYPVSPVTRWLLVEGKDPSQVFCPFNLSEAWEGKGLSSSAWRGFQRAGVSRDHNLRQCVPDSSKEAMHKW